jgi:hypothetical protein
MPPVSVTIQALKLVALGLALELDVVLTGLDPHAAARATLATAAVSWMIFFIKAS